MRFLFLFLTGLFSFLQIQAQKEQRAIDSLTDLLSKPQHDTVKANAMMYLGINYERLDTAKSSKAYDEALAFALEKNLYYYAGVGAQNKSFLYSDNGHNDEALVMLMKAIEYLKKSEHPKTQLVLGQTYVTIANIMKNKNDLKKAAEWQLKGIAIFEQIQAWSSIAKGYTNLASYYKDLNEYPRVEENARKALKYANMSRQRKDLFMAYFYISYSLTLQGKYKESEKVLDSANMYYVDEINFNVLTSYHLIAGYLYMNLDKNELAYDHFKKCYEIALQVKHQWTVTQARLQMSKALSRQKKFAEAEKILLEEQDAVRRSKDFVLESTLLQYLSELHADKGDYKKALSYFKEHKGLEDSLSREDNKKFVSDLEVKYETEKKEKNITQLQADKAEQALSLRRKNTLMLVLALSLFSLAIISYLIYRNYKSKQKLQHQKIAELEAIHQLAATEAVLKGEELERNRLAKDLHDGLGSMLSGIKFTLNNLRADAALIKESANSLDRSIDMLDSSIQEMRRVAHNMMPETLTKFGLDVALKDFCSSINESGVLDLKYISTGLEDVQIDQSVSITVYRVIQELVNNTIKYASAKNAIVQVEQADQKLTITVEDDGKGFDPAILAGTKGIGWSNIRNRIQFLKAHIDLQSKPGKGTSVLIEVNL